MRTFVWAVCLFLSLSSPSGIQSQEPTRTQDMVRDSAAVAVVQKCLSALGGAQVATIQDFTESGNITYHWAGQDVEGSVTVQGKDLAEFRLDVALPQGSRTFRVSGAAGSFTTEDGKTMPIPYSSLIMAGSMTFPSLRIASVLNTSAVAIHYIGLVPFESGKAFQIHVVPPVDQALASPIAKSHLGQYDLYIDPNTYQLLEISESVAPGTDQEIQHQLRYSSYQIANGVLVPYSISERWGGQETWAITLKSVSFNAGPSDTLFRP